MDRPKHAVCFAACSQQSMSLSGQGLQELHVTTGIALNVSIVMASNTAGNLIRIRCSEQHGARYI